MNVSIIIPAYNVENYIEDALDSVFSQDSVPFEVIVVNDGSTDATAEKVGHHTYRSQLVIVTTENRGLGAARNEGLRHATGDYVYFFDSDDLLDPCFLTTIQSTIRERREPDLILFSGKSFQDRDLVEPSSRNLMRPFSAAGLDGNQAVARLVQAGKPIPIAWLYVSKRSLWQDNRLSFKPIVHEDDEVFLPLVLQANSVVVLQDVLMYQRIRPKSIMTSGKTSKNAGGLLVAASTLAELYQNSKGRPAETRRAIRKRAIRTAQRYMRICRKVGVNVDARKMLSSALITRSPQVALIALFWGMVSQLHLTIRRWRPL